MRRFVRVVIVGLTALGLLSGGIGGARAASPVAPGDRGPSSVVLPEPGDDVVPGSFLVRLAPSARSQVHARPKADDTGLPALDTLHRGIGVRGFDRIAPKGQRSDPQAAVFAWYEVTIDAATGETGATDRQLGRLRRAMEQYASSTVVDAVQPNHLITLDATPDDPYFSSTGSYGNSHPDLWGVHKIAAATGWETTVGSSTVTVADIDTGVDRNHPDLVANMWRNPGEVPSNGVDDDGNGYVDDVHGWDWANDDNDPMDDHGHGTHTAGTIAATGNNGTGLTGVAWSARIMALKFMTASGSGTDAGAVRALQYAADMGARISSNSWGSSSQSKALDDAVEYQRTRGVVVVAAAGNSNVDALDFAPASSDGVITVSASDNADAKASFSNWGEKVDVAAPGVRILSTKAATAPMCTGTSVVGGAYCLASGTSMATPHVAGLAVLLLARNPSLTPEQVRQVIRTSASDLGAAGKDASFGYGRIDAARAVATAGNPPLTPVITAPRSRSVTSGAVAIAGTASGAGFASYRVEVGAGRAPVSWQTIRTSNTPVNAGTLATLDTTTLSDGLHSVRLVVSSTTGTATAFQIHDLLVDNFDAAITAPTGRVARGVVGVTGAAGTRPGLQFSGYRLEWGTGTAPSSWSTAGLALEGNGTSAVSSGPLATWDTRGLTDGAYTLRLTVTATSGATAVVLSPVELDGDLVAAWPKTFENGECTAVYSFCRISPVFADLDGDGRDEVVIAEGTNRISAFRLDGTTVPGFPATVARTGTSTFFYDPPAIADVDGDGRPEIIATAVQAGTTLGTQVFVLRGDGSPLAGWTNPRLGWAYAQLTPTVADLDADGRAEILVTEGSRLHAFRLDGSPQPGFPVTLSTDSSAAAAPVAVADLEGDGSSEILVARGASAWVLGPTGAVRSGWPMVVPPAPSGQPMQFTTGLGVADLLGGGAKEVTAVATPSGCASCAALLYSWTSAGAPVAGFPVQVGSGAAEYLAGTAAADLDGDGDDEVVTGYGLLRSFDPAGQRWGSTASALVSPAVANLDGDSAPEILAIGRRDLVSVDGDGMPRWSRRLSRSDELLSPAVAADADDDGQVEVAVGVSQQVGDPRDVSVYVWRLPGSAPGAEWKQYRHDATRTARSTATEPAPPAATPAPDTTAPTITIAAPAPSSTVSGSITASGTATDDRDVALVERRLDGGAWTPATGTTSWSSMIDTRALANGAHTLSIRVTDPSGNAATASTSFTVSNTAADTTAPAVTITSPSDGARIRTAATITASASDAVGVVRIDILIDGSLKSSAAASSISYQWSLKSVSSGYHTITVRAVDAAGNVGAQSITVRK